MQKSKHFGRVRVRLDELPDEGIIDFAELLKKNAPAAAAEPAEDRAREERETVAEPRQAAPALRSDGIEGDDMSDGDDDQHGQQKPKKGRSIFESIIAKWSSLSAPGQERDSDEDDDGALSGGAGDAGIESDDYDYDDGLIDNSELEQKFNSRVIAKHKHKKQRTAGGGFRIDSNLDDDENEEEGDEDEDEDEDEGEEDEEMGEAQDGLRAKDSGSGTAAKRSGHLQKRRRRRQWLRDGDNNFNEVLPVRSAIDAKLGQDGERLTEGGLTKDTMQAIVEIFEIAERNHCAADKLLAWIAQKLDKTVQSIEGRIRKAFAFNKAASHLQQERDKLHRYMDEAARSKQPLVVGNVDDARSFAGIIKSLIDAVRISCNTSKIQTALKEVFKDALRKIRLVRDAQSREPLELHLLHEIVGCARDVLGKGAGGVRDIQLMGTRVSVPQHMTPFTDKLDQIRKSKFPPVEALPPRSSGGPGGAFVSNGASAAAAAVARAPTEIAQRCPYKSNVFDSIPLPAAR